MTDPSFRSSATINPTTVASFKIPPSSSSSSSSSSRPVQNNKTSLPDSSHSSLLHTATLPTGNYNSQSASNRQTSKPSNLSSVNSSSQHNGSYRKQTSVNHADISSKYPSLLYQQQQQGSALQLLSRSATTQSPSAGPPGSSTSASTAGGGGGVLPSGGSSSSTGGANLSKIVVAQVFLLVSTMKEEKWDSQAHQIRQLCEQNGMEVYTKLMRRLITGNAPTIFPNVTRPTENPFNYRLLAEEIQKAAEDTDLAKDVAEAISGSDSDIFRDFDLAGFMRHFNLDALGRSVLALGFKHSVKPDLRNKAHEIITGAFNPMLEILCNPARHEDWKPQLVAKFLREYLSEPIPAFFDLNSKLSLSYAARVRYSTTTIPNDVQSITESLEKMRAKESLVRLFTIAGSNSTNSLETCKNVLKGKWKVELSEEEVADMLVYMATSSHPSDWNPEIFLTAVQEDNIGAAFDWSLLISLFDREDFIIKEPEGLILLINGLLVATKSHPDLEVSRLWSGKWSYPAAQLSVLKAFLSRGFERFNLTKIPNCQKIVVADQFTNVPSKLSALAATFENQKLNSLDAVQALLYLSTDQTLPVEIIQEAKIILDRQWKLVPELLLVGAFVAPKPWVDEYELIVRQLFQGFFEGSPTRHIVFFLLWTYEKLGVIERFVALYAEDHMMLVHILEVAQELQVIWELTKSVPYHLALDIACLAGARELINLEKWLNEMNTEHGKPFVDTTLIFLEIKSSLDYDFQPSEQAKPKIQISLHAGEVNYLLELCSRTEHALSAPEQREFMVSIQRKCIQSYPRLINLGQGHDHIILSKNRDKNTFPPNVDRKMQEYYQKMYSQEISITTMVKDLQQLKNSDTVEDQDLFSCMIHSLFDEYTCYPSYPIEPLATTSVLFGSLIEYHLLEGLALNVALGMVIDAVKNHQPRDNMYKFGLQALKHFPKRLQEWKGFCQHLITIPSLQNTDIMEIAMKVVSSGSELPLNATNGVGLENDEASYADITEPANVNNTNNLGLSETPLPIAAFRSLHLADSPQDEDFYEEPSEDVQDKVLFIVNNLTSSNLEIKLKEIQEYLNDKSYRWFADYLVLQRARLEPNNHKLYVEFLDGLASKTLQSEVLHESYRNAFNLLNSENTAHSPAERAHLKHLAIWLGGLTLAKDKPIKHKTIAFKELLIEAYDTQRLIVALPFTCKVLEQANRSEVFKPPNPWTMAILRLLAELYRFAELKLNQKFEIEVLCKSLGTDIKNIESSTEIRDRPALQSESGSIIETPSFSLLPYGRDDAARPPRFAEGAMILPDLDSRIIISSSLNGFSQNPELKGILLTAIDRAIREIISPVVERSVTIAAISTSQLIIKDFATEANEDKMRTSAHNMVQTMAGSLALVTCKEPLRMSMSNNIRQLLITAGYPEPSFADQAILVFVNDNLDLASAVIEKAAQEKSIPEIDDNLQQSYAIRRAHRERRGNVPFSDPTVSRFAVSLPEPFRLKAGGLSSSQINVYEDFARMPRASSEAVAAPRMSQEVLNDFVQTGAVNEGPSPLPLTQQNLALAQQQQQQQEAGQQRRHPLLPQAASVTRQAQSPAEMVKATRDRLFELLGELERTLKEIPETSFADLPENSQVKALINEAVRITAGSPFMDQLCVAIAGTLCRILYTEVDKGVQAEAYVNLLERICKLSNTAAQDVMTMLVTNETEELYNVPITMLLVRSRLIALNVLDITIARAIDAGKQAAIEFLASLIRKMILGPDPVAMRSDFASSLDKLVGYMQHDPTNAVGASLLQDLQNSELPPQFQMEAETPQSQEKDQLAYMFEEWVQLCHHPSTNEKAFAAYISQMCQKDVLGDPLSSALFVKISIETTLANFAKDLTIGEDVMMSSDLYIPTDALAKLIMLLTKYHLEESDQISSSKAEYLDSILAVIVLVFNNQHETAGPRFNQKVFFRLFSSLFSEYHSIENQLEPYHDMIMISFYNSMMAIQPLYYPAFAFSWTSLVAHRLFIPKMILMADDKGWNLFEYILELLLRYLGNLVRASELSEEILLFYKGVLRFLLVLHHDFPDFLAEYHHPICESIPVNCTQLRNLILSAFPIGSKELPDPFTHGLKVDRLPEIRIAPPISGDITGTLRRLGVKDSIDECLSMGTQKANVQLIVQAMAEEPRIEYGLGFDTVNVNTEALNALVIYVVQNAILTAEKRGTAPFMPKSNHTMLFFELAETCGPQARYFFIGAMANQLRYPNSHTHYFSCTLLSLFGHVKGTPLEQDIRQQITRVLLERLIVHRPHPWGLIITLLELLKNPSYEFWNLDFIKAAPEIERLFDALFAHVNHSPQL